MIRFNEQGPEGLTNMVSPGSPPKLDEEHRAFLARVVEEGPIPAVHGVVRWRGCDLIALLYEEFGIEVSDDTVYRTLKQLGFAHLSARPRAYKQDVEAMEVFKKRARIGGPPVAVETDCAIVGPRGAAEKFLVDLTPQKNVVHGLLRTCEW